MSRKPYYTDRHYLENIKEEWERQQRAILMEKITDVIVGILMIAMLIWILWPRDLSADQLRLTGYSYICDNKPVITLPNYDDQKLTDKWKHFIKFDYEVKCLTLQEAIWQYLTDEMGLSDECAAGIFGNMMVECGSRTFNLQPYIYSPGGYYYGLCQWNTFGHHASIAGGSLEEQLQYLDDTLVSEMGSRAYASFCSSSTPEEAANIFGRYYERCYSPYGRQAEARRAYEQFGG